MQCQHIEDYQLRFQIHPVLCMLSQVQRQQYPRPLYI